MFRIAFLASICAGALAHAQADPAEEWGGAPVGIPATPDEEWGAFPVGPGLPPPIPPPAARRTYRPPPPPVTAGRAGIDSSTRVPAEPNTVSLFGGPTLGQWNRGQAVFIGFPLVGLRLAIGLLDRLDLSVGFESFYSMMNEFHAGFKVGLVRGTSWSVAASVEGMLAIFSQRAVREFRGPRWITGHRNYGISPGVIVSYQADRPRAARLFVDARYLLAFDTEPFATTPLNGVPPRLILGHNGQLHFGAEVPLTSRTSFVFRFGLDVHGRPQDAALMPVAALGLVTGL